MELKKYQGIFPAFYACYDKEGNISPEGVRALARYLKDKGVQGLYVNGSSGECIYLSVEERKLILENVMDEVGAPPISPATRAFVLNKPSVLRLSSPKSPRAINRSNTGWRSAGPIAARTVWTLPGLSDT